MGQRVAATNQLAEAFGFLADRAFDLVERVRRPFSEREAVLQLVGQAAQRHGRLRRRIRVALQQPPVVLVAERVVGQQNVADVAGPTLAPLDRPAAEDRSAAQPRADDHDEQRLELFVGQRVLRRRGSTRSERLRIEYSPSAAAWPSPR